MNPINFAESNRNLISPNPEIDDLPTWTDVISFGRWNCAAGRWFIRERIRKPGWPMFGWTPFCRIRRRRGRAIDLLD